MKKFLILCALASVFVDTVSAQIRERPRAECLKACGEVKDNFPGKQTFERKLAEIREKKQHENDPRKLQRLAEEEQELIEDRKDQRQDVCHKICDGNPEN